ncbi:uncharacterized protein [Palaemon carinicauda]|uniref:uncharacterized protein n=1 Tax=Palaemon carinicauda TaxID=392227 RepID=UPI0035B5B9CB
MINTFFEKKINRLITYSSGGRERQIDWLLCKRDHLTEVRNYKVINGESVAAQHRLVAIDCRLRNCRRSKKTRMDPKIKWWKLRDEKLSLVQEKGAGSSKVHEDVQEWWTENSKVILRIGEEVLGKSSGRRPLNDKELWWWNDEVQERVKTKKEAKKTADISGQEQDKENYKQAKKETRRAVAKVNQRTVFEDELPNEAVTIGVTRREVEQAVKKMKNSKAAGPDNILVEIRKSHGEEGLDILWDLTQKIFT